MALCISYGIRKKDLDDYGSITIEFKNEQDRQEFYFNNCSWLTAKFPLKHIRNMIVQRIQDTVFLDHHYTGPISFIININKITSCKPRARQNYDAFLEKPHLIIDIVTQAKMILNKMSTMFNIEQLTNRKNLVQSYYRRNQRPFREQTIYLNSFLDGLKKDYPSIFVKHPNIIEDTLSDCVYERFGERIHFKPKDKDDQFQSKNSRTEWFRTIAKEKYNRSNRRRIKELCIGYMNFLRYHGRLERKYMNVIQEEVTFHSRKNKFNKFSTHSKKGSRCNKRKMDDTDDDGPSPKKPMDEIDLMISLKRFLRDNPEISKTNFYSRVKSFSEYLFIDDDDDDDDDDNTTTMSNNVAADDDDDEEVGRDDNDDDEEYLLAEYNEDNDKDDNDDDDEEATFATYSTAEEFLKKFSSSCVKDSSFMPFGDKDEDEDEY